MDSLSSLLEKSLAPLGLSEEVRSSRLCRALEKVLAGGGFPGVAARSFREGKFLLTAEGALAEKISFAWPGLRKELAEEEGEEGLAEAEVWFSGGEGD